MKTPFTESDRYQYDLTPDSVVIDGGCNEGNWSKIISEKYNCHVYAFEPIKDMAAMAAERLSVFPKVRVFSYGLGGSTRKTSFKLKGAMTGIASDGCAAEDVTIQDIVSVMTGELGDKHISLAKLNLEGAEYEILERLLESGMISRIENLAIQWHAVVPGFRPRREAITLQLTKTHELTWQDPDFGTGHENHRLKT